jgi:hypothetical protein
MEGMRFGKVKMFFLLNGMTGLILAFYFGPWLFSRVTIGTITTPYETTKIYAAYVVNGKTYSDSYMRNGIEFSKRTVAIRYLSFHPQSSRVNSFMGMWAEPLAWWSVFILASAMLLLMPNVVFSKGTIFQIQRKYPWISMEEYFPLPNPWYWRWRNAASEKEEECEQKTSGQTNETLLLK